MVWGKKNHRARPSPLLQTGKLSPRERRPLARGHSACWGAKAHLPSVLCPSEPVLSQSGPAFWPAGQLLMTSSPDCPPNPNLPQIALVMVRNRFPISKPCLASEDQS